MSGASLDSNTIDQVDVTSLIESYLFDFPDHVHLEQRAGEAWPAAALHDAKLQWGQQRGTLLHKACEDGRLLWVQALMARGADPWLAAGGDGLPPAGWALRGEQEACFLALLMHPGRCPNPATKAQTTLFHLIMAQPDPVLIHAWLDWWETHGDPLCVPLFDRHDAEGRHPSHVVADRPHPDVALQGRLFDLGFARSAQDRCGRTPAERMVWQHPELVPALPVTTRTPATGLRFRRRQHSS